MDGYENGGDDAECRRRRISDAAHKCGARRWLNYGSWLPSAFERREVDEYERELAVRRSASSSSSVAGSSSAGASSSWITPVKRDPEELGPLAVKLEADADPPCRGVIGPEDYLPPGQEDHLERAIMERSVSEAKEADARIRPELEIEDIFLEQGVAASHAHASKEVDLRVMKAEHAKVWINLDSDED
ncbi:Nitrate reductase (NADH) [Hordeum vulgare]|nr:Nitrate reductase (NADH) [Hordeum vulgare]